MGRRYLVTGGAGFIGSNFVRWILDHEPDAAVTNLEEIAYRSGYITLDQLVRVVDVMPRSGYRDYLDRLVAEHGIEA